MNKRVLVLFFVLFFGAVNAVSCGDTITENTVLTADLLDCNADGLIIGDNNISFDCNFHLIQGDENNSSSGIYINDKNSVEIKNCEISGFESGIFLDSNSSENTITGNTISDNVFGLYLDVNAESNLFYNNYFDNAVNALDKGINSWNTELTLGTNIIGGPFIGGNFWSDYNGVDLNSDGIGDTEVPYTADGNILVNGDYFPLTFSWNHAPVLDAFEDIIVNELEQVQVIPVALDEDLDELTFSISDDNRFNWNFDLNAFIWLLSDSDSGNYVFTVTVSDGFLEDTQSVNVTVNDINVSSGDSDNDGIPDLEDKCSNTIGSQLVFGCSWKQILDLKPGKSKGLYKKTNKGISNVFTRQIGWAKNLFD